jgi:hypothetical protein
MENLIETIIALIISSVMLLSGVYTVKEIHDVVKFESLNQISKGLSSSEKMANALTGETLDF